MVLKTRPRNHGWVAPASPVPQWNSSARRVRGCHCLKWMEDPTFLRFGETPGKIPMGFPGKKHGNQKDLLGILGGKIILWSGFFTLIALAPISFDII